MVIFHSYVGLPEGNKYINVVNPVDHLCFDGQVLISGEIGGVAYHFVYNINQW